MKQYTFIMVFSVGLIALAGFQFMNAAWTEPVGSPPNGNVTAPINVGTSSLSIQEMKGSLTSDLFAAVNGVWSDSYCDALGENCKSATSSNSISIVGFYTTPEMTVPVPFGAKYLMITPQASIKCQLPNDTGSGVSLVYMADGSGYARLRADAGTNNGGYVSVTSASNGIIDVSGKTSVNLTIQKETYNNNDTRRATGSWGQTVVCPNGSNMKSDFMSYTILAIFEPMPYTACTTCADTAWYIGSWGVCNAPVKSCGTSLGTQPRTVNCQTSAGVVVADSQCTGVKPITSQSCSKNYGSCK